MTDKEIKEITKAVVASDKADWKICELSFKYLGKSTGRSDKVKEDLYDWMITQMITPKGK